MTAAEAPKPAEALQGEDWAGEMGARWLAHIDHFESMIAPIGEALLSEADYQPGERVIDLGCGGGATTLAIAGAVGPDGEAVGLDIAPALIAAAQDRAARSGRRNIRFVCGDAATATLDGAPFERLFSRFGAMFFADPIPAFAHLRNQLRVGARIDLAVWGPPRDNLWMMEMMGVVRRHIEIPPAIPRAPGPFAFEDVDYLSEVLTSSGLRGIEITPYVGELAIGGPGTAPVEAVDFVLGAMAAGRALEEYGEVIRAAARDDLVRLFEQHFVAGNGVMMGCKVWLVRATA